MDQRYEAFAKTLVNYSVAVQPGEIVYVDTLSGTPLDFHLAIMQEVQKVGGLPFSRRNDERIIRQTMLVNNERLYEFMAGLELKMLQETQKGIFVRDISNQFFSSDVPADVIKMYMQKFGMVGMGYRRVHKNWVLTRIPTMAMAQLFNMSFEKLEDLFFEAVLLDYRKMSEAMQPLVELMSKTDHVRITAPGTELEFSIKGIGAVACDGCINIPDGEVYSAPVRDSVNGTIYYNTLSITRDCRRFQGVQFVIKQGKIVNASCDSGSQEELDKILDTDEGARHFGEFSIGFNPVIKETYGETLFDEKVDGSLHLTPGASYEDANNGNNSAVHWDLVLVQRPEKGGGNIWFDDVLIRKDGRFIPEELQRLNPENLLVA